MSDKRVIKSELIKRVQAASGTKNREQVNHIVNCLLEEIGTALANGEKVELPGFGSFYVSARAERNGRNPQTGEALIIPARNAPGFKAGKDLKDRVRNS